MTIAAATPRRIRSVPTLKKRPRTRSRISRCATRPGSPNALPNQGDQARRSPAGSSAAAVGALATDVPLDASATLSFDVLVDAAVVSGVATAAAGAGVAAVVTGV